MGRVKEELGMAKVKEEREYTISEHDSFDDDSELDHVSFDKPIACIHFTSRDKQAWSSFIASNRQKLADVKFEVKSKQEFFEN